MLDELRAATANGESMAARLKVHRAMVSRVLYSNFSTDDPFTPLHSQV